MAAGAVPRLDWKLVRRMPSTFSDRTSPKQAISSTAENGSAEAMVADVRPDICGVFVQRLENDNNPVRFNDTASLKKK
jgi:ribosome biogenesis protein Nip4